jgi:uncharacterized membrane-anchored protein
MRYFYYRIFNGFSKIPTNDSPALNAMILLSCIICTNIITLLVLLNHFVRINLLYLDRSGLIFCATVLSICMFITNYFLLYRKRTSISEKFKDQTKKAKVVGSILLWIYIIGSFVLVYTISKIFPVM